MISASACARAGHEIGRLEHDRVAVGERRRDLPGGNRDREVPRRDDADDADRLARHLDVDARAARWRTSRRECAAPRRRRSRRSARRASPRRSPRAASCPPRAPAGRRAPRAGRAISAETRSRMSWRSCGVVRDQAGKAARAAATAASSWAALAWAYSPTTSSVLDGLMLRETPSPSTHSPAM